MSTRPRRRKQREGARARLQANIKQTEERVVEKTRNFVDEEISKLTLQIMKLTREHAQVRSSARLILRAVHCARRAGWGTTRHRRVKLGCFP